MPLSSHIAAEFFLTCSSYQPSLDRTTDIIYHLIVYFISSSLFHFSFCPLYIFTPYFFNIVLLILIFIYSSSPCIDTVYSTCSIPSCLDILKAPAYVDAMQRLRPVHDDADAAPTQRRPAHTPMLRAMPQFDSDITLQVSPPSHPAMRFRRHAIYFHAAERDFSFALFTPSAEPPCFAMRHFLFAECLCRQFRFDAACFRCRRRPLVAFADAAALLDAERFALIDFLAERMFDIQALPSFTAMMRDAAALHFRRQPERCWFQQSVLPMSIAAACCRLRAPKILLCVKMLARCERLPAAPLAPAAPLYPVASSSPAPEFSPCHSSAHSAFFALISRMIVSAITAIVFHCYFVSFADIADA